MKLYHYTIADRLVKILISGYLKLTPREPDEGELPCVWLTTQDKWDNTAFYGISPSALDNAGRIRFTIDSERAHVNLASSHQRVLGNWEGLVRTARTVGVDYRDWVVSFDKIYLQHVMLVELWSEEEEEWQVIPLQQIIGGY